MTTSSATDRQALQLARDLAEWQKVHGHPVLFCTEASIDLADRPELLAAMVEANFMYVFIGIETPSKEALKESGKFQNLRKDNVQQIRVIQQSGLWVAGGFIVGFDSDDETIFERQREFIERTAIPWAMVGVLQAPPTTALFERLGREGRLIEDSEALTNFSPPNFRTALPWPTLLRGLSGLLASLYAPESYFRRSLRSLEAWRPTAAQRPPELPWTRELRLFCVSMWRQGVRSDYRLAYWRFLGTLLWKWSRQPARMWLGFTILLSGHHFVNYARQAAGELEMECSMLPEDAGRIDVEPAALADC